MTDHDGRHDPHDPIDGALGDAGKRLRQQGPDAVTSRQALARLTERAEAPTPGRRSWWPALIGAGLAAAAIVGVIAIRADDNETPTLTPVTEPTSTSTPVPSTSIEPSTTLVPSTTGPGPTGASLRVDGGCISVTTAAGSATGCPYNVVALDQLDQRTFVADLDGPVVITSGGADPVADLTVTADDGEFAARCRWNELAPRIPVGGIVEVVVCNDSGVMLATTGPSAEADWSYTHFTLPTPYLPDGADLGFGTTIDGLPGAITFTTTVDGSATCSILLVPDRSGWKESCGMVDGTEPRPALVTIDEISPADTGIWEITIDGGGLVTSALPVAEMAPSSGCAIDSAIDLIRLLPASSVVTGFGCIEDKASMTTGSVLTQNGPPDGSIWSAVRQDGIWAINDSGTEIDSDFAFPIVPRETWVAWPPSTVPGFRSYWWEPIVAIPTQPTVDGVADELLATLAPLNTDPEFALNERLVAVEPDGLALIVSQVDLGGDDSVVGAVLYVWLEQVFDDSGPIGWRASEVLTGDVCGRGGPTEREICP